MSFHPATPLIPLRGPMTPFRSHSHRHPTTLIPRRARSMADETDNCALIRSTILIRRINWFQMTVDFPDVVRWKVETR
ncbi:hypothetical protein M413DRAFT_449265 [Hebeloma cylindrosporum]|uniref:Uncharacterized protein n=1 Tax=Hebeloma cylindrosporum TaxID=76867 RepID=A0A0C2Y584_HEBCY|nr:hypothetical protein M413DRAFT_449265 [Hebeloma cylindrosporum h7]